MSGPTHEEANHPSEGFKPQVADETSSLLNFYEDEFIEASHNPSSTGSEFDRMTVADLLGQFIQSPLKTWQILRRMPLSLGVVYDVPVGVRDTSESVEELPEAIAKHSTEPLRVDRWLAGGIGLQGLAYVVALVGCFLLVSGNTRFETEQLHRGTPYLIAGFVLWLAAQFIIGRSSSQIWVTEGQLARPDGARSDRAELIMRGAMLAAGLLLAFLAWSDTGVRQGQINQFRLVGFWAWIGSIVLVTAAFAPASWTPANIAGQFRGWLRRLRFDSTTFALILIIIVGASFRLYNLDGVPPEMTSDHIEKILDAQRVVEGSRDVFFANNGGREPFQMYAMAVLSKVPGFGMNFTTLKLLSVLEGLITLPVMWWMGREVTGPERRGLGIAVGLALAALVAVSYWHVAITRLALRIVLTPLVAALLMIFLSRGMRDNRRGDFVLAGLILGFGFYTYQAVRMLPVVVVAGLGISALFHLRQYDRLRQMALNLIVVILVSFVIFVPLFRYSMDFPDQFWMRASGRLFGDDMIIEVNESGQRVPRDATIDERLAAFKDNLPVLTKNIRNALLMFHWKGDVAWINGLPNHPAFDPFSGALLMVGLAAWLVLILRYRDPVHILIPVMVLVMIMPSALSIAAPLENPSATRMSGSLPPIYLITALPLALAGLMMWQVAGGRFRRIIMSGGLATLVLGGALLVNTDTYFNGYRDSYVRSWSSHRVPADILREFAEIEGRYGNAFIVGYQHWLDHRIVGIEAGAMKWANAIADPNDSLSGIRAVPDFLNDAWYCPAGNYLYRIDPERDLLFFYKAQDDDAARLLLDWFPEGMNTLVVVERAGDDFYVYRVPALGENAFERWLADHAMNPRCPAQ